MLPTCIFFLNLNNNFILNLTLPIMRKKILHIWFMYSKDKFFISGFIGFKFRKHLKKYMIIWSFFALIGGARERERKRKICLLSTYLCIHWLILTCALTRDQTYNFGVSSGHSNWLSCPTTTWLYGVFIYLFYRFIYF